MRKPAAVVAVHPADEFITDEVVITQRSFKLTHEALCAEARAIVNIVETDLCQRLGLK